MKRVFLILALIASFGMTGCAAVGIKHNLDPASNPDLKTSKVLVVHNVGKAKGFFNSTLESCYTIPPGTYNITGDDEKRYYALTTGTGGEVTRGAICNPTHSLTIPKDVPNTLCIQEGIYFPEQACFEADFAIKDVDVRGNK